MANHLQVEQRRAKTTQLKKQKAERTANRTERLSKKNPKYIESQLDQLKKTPSPTQADLRRIQTLEHELSSVLAARKRAGIVEREADPRKSVFYDEKINPTGAPPPGFEPMTMFDVDSDYATDDDVKNIPWPKHRQGSLAAASAKVTYESQPVLRDFDKEVSAFVPAAVLKKRRVEPSLTSGPEISSKPKQPTLESHHSD